MLVAYAEVGAPEAQQCAHPSWRSERGASDRRKGNVHTPACWAVCVATRSVRASQAVRGTSRGPKSTADSPPHLDGPHSLLPIQSCRITGSSLRGGLSRRASSVRGGGRPGLSSTLIPHAKQSACLS
ncbi:hypothetical protein NDU88_004023 [Pleurodeles waltl]|uniref:Uncharacterized protein n=1 Tax=Pleurodeles waltl TaxID=8319 RepID=A0AAV7SHL5_PLEWA|nr:hypothetical protein NDU88_004023 [Pleurodeles waltl]